MLTKKEHRLIPMFFLLYLRYQKGISTIAVNFGWFFNERLERDVKPSLFFVSVNLLDQLQAQKNAFPQFYYLCNITFKTGK